MISATSTAFSSPRPAPDRTDDQLLAFAFLDTIEMEVAGQHLWRVCDRHIASGPERFMGLIEETNGHFDAMVVGNDYLWTVLPTLWDALAHILHTHDARSAHRSPEQPAQVR